MALLPWHGALAGRELATVRYVVLSSQLRRGHGLSVQSAKQGLEALEDDVIGW